MSVALWSLITTRTPMKPQALIVLLLAAVLGVFAYFVLLGGDEIAPVSVPGGPAQSVSEGVADQASVESVEGLDHQQDSASEVGLTRTAVKDVAVTSASAGFCQLHGRIVDGTGVPRGGLALSIDTWGMGQDFEIEAMFSGQNVAHEEVTTATDGTFRARVQANRQGSILLPDVDLVFRERLRFTATAAEQDLGDLVVIGAARLAGVIQDQDGKPVSGVVVAAALGAVGFDNQSNVTSGEDGSFSVGKLRAGNWLLTTKSSQHLPTSSKVKLVDEQQVTDLVVVVHPGHEIAGRVIDDRGVGVAGMKVASQRVLSLDGVDIQRYTDDEAVITDELGNFRLAGLEGRTVKIRASGPGHAMVTKSNVKTGSNNVELRVDRLGSIHGVLVTMDGAPIVGSRVTARSQHRTAGPVEMAEGLLDFDVPGSGPSAETDEEGKFVLNSVKPGLVKVHARGKTHRAVSQSGVQVRAAQAVRGIRLLADVGAVARVKVVDVDGKAITGAKVLINRMPKPVTSGFNMSVVASTGDGNDILLGGRALGSGVTDEDGVATVMGLPGGEASFRATHAKYAPSDDLRVAMPASGSIDRELVMSPPSYIEVTVTNADGSACVGTDVLLAESGGGTESSSLELMSGIGSNSGRTKPTDAEGKVRFGPVPAGAYVASLLRGKKAHDVGGMAMFAVDQSEKIESSATPVVVGVGETNAVLLTMPILARLTGVVMGSDGPVVGCGIELTSAADDTGIPGLGGRQQRTKEGGRFSFEGVEVGDYVLRYGKADQIVKSQHEVTVPSNTAIVQQNLTLRTGTVRVLVLSKDDAEPVERAEVRLMRGGDVSKPGEPQIRSQVVMVSATRDGAGEDVSMMTFGQDRVLTDEDGMAEFKDVPVGDYTLKVESRKYTPFEKAGVSVVELQLTDCGTIELAGAGQIRGVVKNEAGTRTMAMIEYRLLGSADWVHGEVVLRGAYRLTGVAPGSYEVRARRVGAVTGEPSEPQVVEVEVGKTEVANLTVK